MIKKYLVLLLVTATTTFAQNPTLFCVLGVINEKCTCNFMIYNPNGMNNFTIAGNPVTNCSMEDVVEATGSGMTKNVPSVICSGLPNLERLEMENLGVVNLTGNPFRFCSNLKTLKLSYNNIQRVPPYAFSNTILETLNLDDNVLNDIDEFAFDSLSSLKVLNLSVNTLTNMNGNVLEHLVNLNTLYMSRCWIASLNIGWFRNLEKLSGLDLSYNGFMNIPGLAFDYLSNLMWLDLSNGAISSISESNFRNNTNLMVLNLRNNLIPLITSGAFANQQKLYGLYLSQKVNLNVSADAFQPLTSLQILEMRTCGFTEMKPEWFSSLARLMKIDLSGNKIPSIPDDAFAQANLLESIDFSHNLLEVLDSRSFGSLQNLLELNFQNNLITEVDHHFMAQSTRLSKVNLADNECTQLNADDFNSNRSLYMDEMKECFNKFDLRPITLNTTNSTQFNWYSIRSDDGWDALEVTVMAYENVHIGLTDSTNPEEPLIEIQIGQNRNRYSNILEEGEVVFTDPTRGRLNAAHGETFIIGWRFGIVMVFKKGDQFPFMAHPKQNRFSVNFFGLRTLFQDEEDLEAEWTVLRRQSSSTLAMMKIYQDIETKIEKGIPIDLRMYLR